MGNTNQQQFPSQTLPQNQSFQSYFTNQKGNFILLVAIVVLVLVVGAGAYLLGVKDNQPNKVTTPGQTNQPSPISMLESSPTTTITSTTLKLVAFMRQGDIFIKDFSTNQERKVSKTPKVEGPILSPSGKDLYYFQIVHAGGGFPRYSLFVSDTKGQNEKTFVKGANHYASKLKWSSGGDYLGMVLFGNDIPGGVNYSEEAYIYDVSTQKETLISKIKRTDLSNDQYVLEGSCNQLQPQYISFCNEYSSYLNKARSDEYKEGYKSDEYKNSKYTKPNYILSKSQKLGNGLVVLEYYTGEPQNPESKWGIGGGVFVPGYDEGVTQTYTVLLDESTSKAIIELPLAIDTDFLF